jgi:hypothetical protein
MGGGGGVPGVSLRFTPGYPPSPRWGELGAGKHQDWFGEWRWISGSTQEGLVWRVGRGEVGIADLTSGVRGASPAEAGSDSGGERGRVGLGVHHLKVVADAGRLKPTLGTRSSLV